jgi:hypothetical protein
MRFVLPLPPNRANARWHWRTERQKKVLWFTLADVLYKPSKEPPIEAGKARISATLYTWNKMDVDNLFGRLKWPCDWLERRGWIAGDDPDSIEWAGIPQQFIDRKNQRVEITLEAL